MDSHTDLVLTEWNLQQLLDVLIEWIKKKISKYDMEKILMV